MHSKIVLAGVLLAFLSPVMLGALFTVPVAGTPETINVGLGQNYEKIQWAIGNATAGDTVFVASGTYHEHLLINKSLTLRGAGSDTTFINGDGENRTIVSIIASNVEVTGFTIENGSEKEEYGGIQIMHNVSVTIRNNVIRKSYYGVFLSRSNSCSIIDNTITENYKFGIRLSSESCSNRFIGNNITKNLIGIGLAEVARYNVLYHNNFINNPTQVAFPPGYATIWDDGYPSGGNYWSNHSPPDLSSGPYQNETGSDGIGDTPYPYEEFPWDRYPLMGPISVFNAGAWNDVTYYVHTISNSTVSDFHFKSDEAFISFNVTEQDDTVGFCRVTIPNELLWCDSPEQWEVLVNDTLIEDRKVIPNIYYTYVYFTYNHTRQTVRIVGTTVIPIPPNADAGPDQSVLTGITVTFDGSGSTDNVGIAIYTWSFVDVTLKTLTGIQPKYIFNNTGDFEVTLNVSDYAGNWNTTTMWVHVSLDNIPPVANAGPDQTVDEDTLVTLDGSGSTDNGNITSYTWTFIDETPQTLTGVNPTYTFKTPGEYTITLNVTDTAGNWDTDTVRIIVFDVTNPSIDVVSQEPEFPDDGEKVTITVNVTDEDSGVRNVILSYITNEGATWTNVTMNKLTGDIYVGEIPGLPAGTNVQYKIIAYDKAGNFEVDNKAGQYYIYTVIPEFPAALLLSIFMVATLIAMVFVKRRD